MLGSRPKRAPLARSSQPPPLGRRRSAASPPWARLARTSGSENITSGTVGLAFNMNVVPESHLVYMAAFVGGM